MWILTRYILALLAPPILSYPQPKHILNLHIQFDTSRLWFDTLRISQVIKSYLAARWAWLNLRPKQLFINWLIHIIYQYYKGSNSDKIVENTYPYDESGLISVRGTPNPIHCVPGVFTFAKFWQVFSICAACARITRSGGKRIACFDDILVEAFMIHHIHPAFTSCDRQSGVLTQSPAFLVAQHRALEKRRQNPA